jgi:hypothetical protein
LSTEILATKTYWQIKKDSKLYEAPFSSNGIVGIMHETKAEYRSDLGSSVEYIYGKKILPFNYITKEYLDIQWLTETSNKWATAISNIEENWRAYFLLIDSIINPDKESIGTEIRNLKSYDLGNSKTNTLFFYFMNGGKGCCTTSTLTQHETTKINDLTINTSNFEKSTTFLNSFSTKPIEIETTLKVESSSIFITDNKTTTIDEETFTIPNQVTLQDNITTQNTEESVTLTTETSNQDTTISNKETTKITEENTSLFTGQENTIFENEETSTYEPPTISKEDITSIATTFLLPNEEITELQNKTTIFDQENTTKDENKSTFDLNEEDKTTSDGNGYDNEPTTDIFVSKETSTGKTEQNNTTISILENSTEIENDITIQSTIEESISISTQETIIANLETTVNLQSTLEIPDETTDNLIEQSTSEFKEEIYECNELKCPLTVQAGKCGDNDDLACFNSFGIIEAKRCFNSFIYTCFNDGYLCKTPDRPCYKKNEPFDKDNRDNCYDTKTYKCINGIKEILNKP